MIEIFIIMLAVIIILFYLLLKFGVIKRRVIVTIVENLPIGLFRDKNKSYEIENKVYVKEINKEKIEENLNSKEENTNNENNISDKDNISKNIEDIDISNNKTVYWTPKGKTYHTSKSCFALSRSKVILEGSAVESEKDALCDLCRDYM